MVWISNLTQDIPLNGMTLKEATVHIIILLALAVYTPQMSFSNYWKCICLYSYSIPLPLLYSPT